jgi:YD repeat-containing protein
MTIPILDTPALVDPVQDDLGQPTPGRFVHYTLPDGPRAGETRAALITAVFGSRVNLTVFLDQYNDCGLQAPFEPVARAWSVDYDQSGQPGSWRWPPRV